MFQKEYEPCVFVYRAIEGDSLPNKSWRHPMTGHVCNIYDK